MCQGPLAHEQRHPQQRVSKAQALTNPQQENCELNLSAFPDRWDVKDAIWGVAGHVTAWGPVTDLGQE